MPLGAARRPHDRCRPPHWWVGAISAHQDRARSSDHLLGSRRNTWDHHRALRIRDRPAGPAISFPLDRAPERQVLIRSTLR